MTGPKFSRPRAENLPIGWLSRRGSGCGITARKVEDILVEHAAVLVAVADTGEVYAIDPCGMRAVDLEHKRPEWIVGTYATGVDREVVLGDLQARAKELRGEAA